MSPAVAPHRVWKFALPAYGPVTLSIALVRWLHVDWQGDKLHVWAQVLAPGTDEPWPHTLYVAMTGDAVGPGWTYLGSASMLTSRGEPYVVHVYLLP